MPITKLTVTLILLAFSVPAVWAGQFGDYNPHGFLSDYCKRKPEGGGSDAYV